MLETTFSSVYDQSASTIGSVTSAQFLMCCAAAIVCGLIVAFVYMFKHRYSKNFVITLALLPLIVQMVITVVNGNIGAGIAVMGVFNLVRFRSIPGTAKDIASVFLAMAVGLACGMGYLGLAALFTVIVAVVNIVFVISPLGNEAPAPAQLCVTVPEDLEFNGMFDDILSRYCNTNKLVNVQTTNMGSLYKLNYEVCLKDKGQSKALIDEIRCLNGNLKVSLGYLPTREGL